MINDGTHQIRIAIKRRTAFTAGLIGIAMLSIPALAQGLSQREQYCMELEHQLANDWVRGNSSQERLPKLNQEIREQDHIYQSAQAKAERADCYQSFFIFGRELRRTRKCLALHNQIEEARRQLERLNEQRESIIRSRDGRGRRRELMDALARNGCGGQYQREARRQSPGIFDSIFGNNSYYDPPPVQRRSTEILPYATYRTMCVRLCDGYYFPISYSTLPSRFNEDANICANNCAAPAELYIYRNPGEDVQHMTSLAGQPYGDLPEAWRYRKEYVKGCSCKQAEYSPVDNFEQAPEKSGAAPSSQPPDNQFAEKNTNPWAPVER